MSSDSRGLKVFKMSITQTNECYYNPMLQQCDSTVLFQGLTGAEGKEGALTETHKNPNLCIM